MALHQFAADVLPPVLYRTARSAYRTVTRPAPPDENRLFEGYDNLFNRAVASAHWYLEYGAGASTVWVLNNTSAVVTSVDSSKAWLNSVKTDSGAGPNRLKTIHVDIGRLRDWGRPVNYAKRAGWHAYAQAPWDMGSRPDTVLIDGRFRVSCFAATLAAADPGTVVLFDDYVERPHYHVVQELLRPDATNGRQARFVVPKNVDREAARRMRDEFALAFE